MNGRLRYKALDWNVMALDWDVRNGARALELDCNGIRLDI